MTQLPARHEDAPGARASAAAVGLGGPSRVELDDAAVTVFAEKGREGGPNVPQSGDANAVKVRRVMQLTEDFAPGPWPQLRILDLGCGDGVYAIEAAIAGARVVGLDARPERMSKAHAIARRHGLAACAFVQDDVRRVCPETYGRYDVVYCLGLLYHLDVPDVFTVLQRVSAVCSSLLIVDTLIATSVEREVSWDGATYEGRRHREHDDDDSPATRAARQLRSIDNTFSFRLTRPSLVAALTAVGFTSVLECHAPREPGKAAERVTLLARKGQPVHIATYPWVNALSDAELCRRFDPAPDPITR